MPPVTLATTKLGPVGPMPRHVQPKKAWKHFHDPAEHWERLAAQDLSALRAEADRAAGVSRYDHPDLPALNGPARRAVDEVLWRHHDGLYGPIYLTELAAPGTYWNSKMDAQHRQRALTPRSVFVVVALGDPSIVITAYRPKPPTVGLGWTEDDFQQHGRWQLAREEQMNRDTLLALVAESLRGAIEHAPASSRELWWLAVALGFGRTLADSDELRSLVRKGEGVLQAVAPSIRTELAAALDRAGARRRLADGIAEESPEDLEQALADAEDLLAVTDALELDQEAADLCGFAESVLALSPPAWRHIADRATSLVASATDATRPLARLWSSIASAPTSTGVASWRASLARRVGRGTAQVQQWVSESLASIEVRELAPMMGSIAPQPWEVHGIPAASAPAYRAFVIDEKRAAGHEVTDQFVRDDGRIWELDRDDDRALVVVVASSVRLPGRTLADVLDEADRATDATVGVRLVSLPRR
jgi:hypothetical protein